MAKDQINPNRNETEMKFAAVLKLDNNFEIV